jgi:hypothetical protein
LAEQVRIGNDLLCEIREAMRAPPRRRSSAISRLTAPGLQPPSTPGAAIRE